MPDDKDTAPVSDAREARVEQILASIRAQPALRQMAERLADLPEGQSFGQIELDLRDLAHGVASSAHQAGLEAGKKGYLGSSASCPLCQGPARFVEHRAKTWLTATGEVSHARAYYHCASCGEGFSPFDAANRLGSDRLSAGLRPLVCKAAVLASFPGASDDILRDFAGVRVSASTVRRASEKAGDDLAGRQRAGDIASPERMRPWDFSLGGTKQEKAKAKASSLPTTAYLGLDAFSVPMQKPGGKKEQHRMMYVGILYTPDKGRSLYLADFDLARMAAQMRCAAEAFGLGAADRLVAVSDAGNGLEEALRRNFDDGLLCILDWYHAAQHLHDYSKCLHPDEGEARAWAEQAKTVLWEQGGRKLGEYLGGQAPQEDAATAEELRKLVGYFGDNEHRTDYPEYRRQGLDIGSGPTEAACKIMGARLKGSGMRWVEDGAERIAPLRALFLSGKEVWDAYWCLAS